MPWPPEQARAIYASYARRGKKPPTEVEAKLHDSLRGTHKRKIKRLVHRRRMKGKNAHPHQDKA